MPLLLVILQLSRLIYAAMLRPVVAVFTHVVSATAAVAAVAVPSAACKFNTVSHVRRWKLLLRLLLLPRAVAVTVGTVRVLQCSIRFSDYSTAVL